MSKLSDVRREAIVDLLIRLAEARRATPNTLESASLTDDIRAAISILEGKVKL